VALHQLRNTGRGSEINVVQLKIEDVIVDREWNCRERFTRGSVSELAQSLARYKQMMPVLVVKKGEKYSLVAGFRRVRGLKMAKIEHVWAVVTDLDEHEARVQNLLENLDRQQLNMLEEARAVAKIFEGREVSDAALMLNRSENWIKSRLKLVRMGESIQKAAASGRLTEGQVRELQRMTDKRNRMRKLNRWLSEDYVEKESPIRTSHEIQEMMVKLCEKGVDNICIRVLRWMLGRMTSTKLLEGIDEN